MKATGLFRWNDGNMVYMQHYETVWGNLCTGDKMLRRRFYLILLSEGKPFYNLELIEHKVEP
jgi:hypothetical protein